MYKARAVTAYVYAMLVEHSTIISGSFEIEDERARYNGMLYANGLAIRINDQRKITTIRLPVCFPEHVMHGMCNMPLRCVIDLPLCGIQRIDEDLKQLVISHVEKDLDDTDESTSIFLIPTEHNHELEMKQDFMIYSRRPSK